MLRSPVPTAAGSVHEQVLTVLGRRLSSINAGNVVARALRDARITPGSLTADDVRRLQPVLERGLRLFLPISTVAEVLADLARALAPAEPLVARLIAIRTEPDISEARLAARVMCDQLGARRVITQKVATVVSELARNIYMYTPGGTVELIPGGERRPHLTIEAIDQGEGIANLDEVLAGRYRSRTGLGAGLIGTRRLVDSFAIDTGPGGTRVVVGVDL